METTQTPTPSTTTTPEVAQPRAGTVRDYWGDPCHAATPNSYPLTARCVNCHAQIVLLAGDADWYHHRTRQGRCESRSR